MDQFLRAGISSDWLVFDWHPFCLVRVYILWVVTNFEYHPAREQGWETPQGEFGVPSRVQTKGLTTSQALTMAEKSLIQKKCKHIPQ